MDGSRKRLTVGKQLMEAEPFMKFAYFQETDGNCCPGLERDWCNSLSGFRITITKSMASSLKFKTIAISSLKVLCYLRYEK